MADTRRALTALQTLLADNTAGDISPQDLRDAVISVIGEKIVQAGVDASAPSDSQLTGDVYLATDGYYVRRWDGAGWTLFGPCFPFTDPLLVGLNTWVNQGSSTITTVKSSLVLTGAATGTGANLVARVKTAPATPWTLTAFILPPPTAGKSVHSVGLCFRDSASGKMHVFDFCGGTSSQFVRSSKFTTATSFSADYLFYVTRPISWFRIQDNGTSRICSVSADGQNWLTVHTVGRTDFLTADQFGLHVSTENSATPNLDCVANCLHLAVT